ncbi:MAG TPA: ABC transporter ATP-binding protein [Opitutaceae bacterium]
MNAIECSNLGRSFGRVTALQNLNLEVPAGSFFALLGPNGAGKTTLLKLLLNLLQPSAGSAKVLGQESVGLGAADFQRIGYVAEGQDLPDWMTVAQLMDFCRPLYPTWDRALEKRLIGTFDLPVDRKLRTVSRGTRMKAALLSNLAFRPELLLLDEPFSGLDPLMRDDFIQGLLELPGDDRPRTILVSSHDIDEVERLADQVGFLSGGRLLVRESADELRARFRRVEIVGSSLPSPASFPTAWSEVQRPGENVLQFVHTAFTAATTERELEAAFPSAQVSTRALSLREIFLVLARLERVPRKEAA